MPKKRLRKVSKKRKPIRSRTTNLVKNLQTRSGEQVNAYQTRKRFEKARRQKPSESAKNSLRHHFKRKIEPEFRKFVDRSLKKGRKRFLLKINTRQNFKGKRIRGGFQNRRVKLSNMDQFERFIEDYIKQMEESMDRYLKRKDLNSISISGIEMEVIVKRKKKKK